ncbi:MFS transporter [Domibacillus sp. A3M-37]|uniref:MFS transporter n=1 Tax=Domibacillus sp. A3M-37 TaxID=2962037 RepID=UPI0020B728E1|nr:MFS transporter [Domibacillus sp. A3M-37]MCP3761693.1 MFS transporter [Domibacillus sp. A3M-37]
MKFRFWMIIAVVAVSGFTQGMLIPLVAIIFEQDGVSSSVNGLHAAAMYAGMLVAAPFMEGLLRKFGYRRVMIAGGFADVACLALFAVWKSLLFWLVLRIVIGIGNNMLHFASQTWLTAFSPEDKRGRNIALYGLSFGLGFGIGPVMTRLAGVAEPLPFLLASFMSLLVWSGLFFLKNDYPEEVVEKTSFIHTFHRFGRVWKYGWVALLFPFGYGFLESSLNGSFPVYALRLGLDVSALSIILSAFAIGSIVFQLPLGMLSDRFIRRNVLMTVTAAGVAVFMFAGWLEESKTALFVCFFIAGMLVGSIFSLGLSYMVDLLPKTLLPAGNIMCSILFSIGSIFGPFVGGTVIQFGQGFSFFYTISIMLLLLFTALFFSGKQASAFKPSS